MAKNKILSLSEFTKKFKKQHPELKAKKATQKAHAEYKKYVKDNKDKKTNDKDLEILRKEAMESE
jgi:hypothetical protein